MRDGRNDTRRKRSVMKDTKLQRLLSIVVLRRKALEEATIHDIYMNGYYEAFKYFEKLLRKKIKE